MRNQATKKNSPHIDEQRQNAKAKASPITKGRQTAVKLLFKRIARGVRWGKVQSGTGAHSNCRSFRPIVRWRPGGTTSRTPATQQHSGHNNHTHTHIYTRALPHIYIYSDVWAGIGYCKIPLIFCRTVANSNLANPFTIKINRRWNFTQKLLGRRAWVPQRPFLPLLPSFMCWRRWSKKGSQLYSKKENTLLAVCICTVCFFPPFIAAFKNHSRVKRQISVKCSRSQSQTEGEGSNRSAGEDGGGNARCRSLYTSTGNSRCLSILRATVFNWGCSCYRQYGGRGGEGWREGCLLVPGCITHTPRVNCAQKSSQ